jgi:hypothetical protein
MAFGLKKREPPNPDAGAQRPGGQAFEELADPRAQPPHTHSRTDGPDPPTPSSEGSSGGGERRSAALSARIGSLVRAIEDNDEDRIEEAILRLSHSRHVLAPLAFAVGAFVMLFDGLRLLVANWRLTLVQILPAMWIWLAMLDLNAHVLHGKSFTALGGPVLIPLGLIVAFTVASFFLNAVFAFAISRPGRPEIRPAVAQARQHLRTIIVSGAVLGVPLAFSTTLVTRWGRPWFTISLGIVIGVMMICYLAVPARLTASSASSQGATSCGPPRSAAH